MIFSSYEFIYIFLPITIVLYFILSKVVTKNIQLYNSVLNGD